MQYAVTATDLSKTYRTGRFSRTTIPALRDVTLSVSPGEIFGLLGPNGAGKTTFLKILLTLTHATSGSATLLGRSIPDTAVKAQVGYLPENHRFPGHMTGRQVMDFFGRLSGLPDSTLRSRIPTLLEMAGIAQWSGMRVRKYSKGMLQRLGLAQALVNDPQVVFLDEPTDGVDPVGRKEIRDILRDLRQKGKTIFLNSHLLSEVESVSDRVAILHKGALLRVGTVEELTSTGTRYDVTVEGALPAACLAEATAMVLHVTPTAGGISAECASLEELNRVIDLLRRHGALVSGIVRQRTTLEESFLSLIKKETAA
jgi:ABC-2 type transport system ATP-binding protein